MNEPDKSRASPASSAVIVVAIIALLLVAYVLSIGPAMWLWQQECLPTPIQNAIWPFYEPVFAAVRHNGYLNTKLFWYLKLWGFEVSTGPFTVHCHIPTFS